MADTPVVSRKGKVMTHVDQNIDWFAHARQQKLAFQARTQQAARALAEKKALPPPLIQKLVAVEEAPLPPKATEPSALERLIDYRPSWRIIAQEVSEKHNIPLKELQGKRRFKRLSVARREIFWRLRHEKGMSLLDIARKMGKDHTSVLHGLRVYVRDNPPPSSTGEEACNIVRS
jgi:DNA-binding transcriptional ArsR family regulator